MLTLLRKKNVAKRVLWALAVILIPAFVLWGAGNISKKNLGFKYVGSIAGKNISVKEFAGSIKTVRAGLFLNYFSRPEALDKLLKDRGLINRLAWENLIIENGAKKARVNASDGEVVNFITKHPLFTRDGVFNEKFYNYFLQNSLGTAPRDFEENVRDFIISVKFKNDIVKDITVTDEELRRFYQNEFEKAEIDYILIDKSAFKEGTSVSKEEIISFYEGQKKRFTEPEKIILQYIRFPHEKEGEKEKALVKMKQVYDKLRKRPRGMEKIASEFGLSVKETPPFSRNEIIPGMGNLRNVSAVAFGLQPMAEAAPMVDENDTGASFIIMVKERRPSRIKSVEEVASYITDLIKNEKAAAAAKKEADELREEASSAGMDLPGLAKKHGFKLMHTEFISRFDYIEEIGESYAIVDEAFKLEKGAISGPIKVRKGYALIEPAAFLLINEDEFSKEKDSYRDKLLSAKKTKALRSWLMKAGADSVLNVNLEQI